MTNIFIVELQKCIFELIKWMRENMRVEFYFNDIMRPSLNLMALSKQDQKSNRSDRQFPKF